MQLMGNIVLVVRTSQGCILLCLMDIPFIVAALVQRANVSMTKATEFGRCFMDSCRELAHVCNDIMQQIVPWRQQQL